ncbi:hypothetical protein DFP72DRAFT_839329 [Ephemerocybe angulata]|uniref:CCHC-type domain-containing protein n=1 Tax=Ephemerocybe angulata TaxID=980116 RepID=A0A8H6IH02_9AGAR|nr:hypothetical protein DFP72DRAFT_839329 [Tulosesus angulatus]
MAAIKSMKMDGRKPVQDFFIKWESEAVHTGLNGNGLLVFLQEAITKDLRDGMSNRYGLTNLKTYQAFKSAAISVDKEQCLENLITARTNPIRPTKTWTARSWRGNNNGDDKAKGSNNHGKENNNPGSPAASTSKSPTSAPLPQEAEALKRNCFNCGSPDHKVAQCNVPKKPRHAIRNFVLDMDENELELLNQDLQNEAYFDKDASKPSAHEEEDISDESSRMEEESTTLQADETVLPSLAVEDLPPTKHPTEYTSEDDSPKHQQKNRSWFYEELPEEDEDRNNLPSDHPYLLEVPENLARPCLDKTTEHIINNLSHPEIAATQNVEQLPDLGNIEENEVPDDIPVETDFSTAIRGKLARIREASITTAEGMLRRHVHPSRRKEITEPLLVALREKPICHALELLTDLGRPKHVVAQIAKDPCSPNDTLPGISQLLMRATVQSTTGDVAFDCDTLLDSGASQCYIDKEYALSAGLTLRQLAHPMVPRTLPEQSMQRSSSTFG